MMNTLDRDTLRVAQRGDIIEFGSYPQAAGGGDSSPIHWRVLEHARGELFVASEYLLDCKRHHNEFTETTWRDRDIRSWLDKDLCRVAFTPAELDVIKVTRCGDNGADSPDTEDRLFLLSVAEVRALTAP